MREFQEKELESRSLEEMHKFFFDWFEDKRKNDGLYYSVRKNNRNDMLSRGCIFLGTGYIAIPLVNHRDCRHRTASVQFVYDAAGGNSYSIEIVSRNLADPKFTNSDEEKVFCEKVVAFIEVLYKYAEDNGGEVLTPEESESFFSRDLEPEVPLFIAHQSQHRPKNNEYQAKLFFNESKPEAALEKFYAFWKEYGIEYWKDYFESPASTVLTINKSLAKIDHSVAQCDWPLKVDWKE